MTISKVFHINYIVSENEYNCFVENVLKLYYF